MKPLTEYIKPALVTLAFVMLIGGYYWWEHRPQRDKPETAGQAQVVVAKTVNACFSDMVRVTGFIVPKREAVVGAPASPQAGPMFRIAVNNEIELDAEVPSVHILKLNPGATVFINHTATT